MSIVKVLVPVTGSKRDAVALATAFAAAKPFGAHVKAIFCHPDPREAAVPYAEMPLAPDVVQELVDTARDLASAASKSARSTLASAAQDAQVRIVAAPQMAETVTASFEEKVGHVNTCIELSAQLCDLIVFPPIGEDDPDELHEAFVRTLTKTERPVLLCADIAPSHVGQNIAIGWDGGMAAAHALSAALPYLRKANSVKLYTVKDRSGPSEELEEVKTYLSLHGVAVTTGVIERGAKSVAEHLTDAAASAGCDMLVVGGYGHSRMVETVFGGVTQFVASHPRIPIFMVH